jgi:uncharacterized membrane protein
MEQGLEKRQHGKPVSNTGTIDKSKTRHAITIGLPPEKVFEFFRNFQNLPRFMKDLKEVRVADSKNSHWVVEMKSGTRVEWDAEITGEVYGQSISWRSVKGSDVSTQGHVTFEEAPPGRGTIVRLSMDYSVPGGKLTEWIKFFTGEDPDTLTITNLKRLKAVLETGEFPTVEGQPTGRDPDATPVMKH